MSFANQTQRIDADFDLKMMKKAIALARKSETKGEVPVGAVVADQNGQIIATATNLRETRHTVLGHAELVALHRACNARKSWRLNGCTLYVTLEPCFMCAGALVQTRVARVVYGAVDAKGGALHSLAALGSDARLNHQFRVTAGFLADECGQMLKDFFKRKRSLAKQKSLTKPV